jgi:hypothetical protein
MEIPNPPVSEIGLSSFARLDPTEQTIALHIGQKLDCPVWQTETSGFSRKTEFSSICSKTRCLLRQIVHHYILIPGNMLYSKIIEKSNNFQAFVKICIQRPAREIGKCRQFAARLTTNLQMLLRALRPCN